MEIKEDNLESLLSCLAIAQEMILRNITDLMILG
jgi:hypothetical protein